MPGQRTAPQLNTGPARVTVALFNGSVKVGCSPTSFIALSRSDGHTGRSARVVRQGLRGRVRPDYGAALEKRRRRYYYRLTLRHTGPTAPHGRP
jgi:hypothetical protein